MSIRAFLSHASSEKHFVQKVAEQLGRAAVVFDAYEFSTGDDLAKAIRGGIDKSSIFVLCKKGRFSFVKLICICVK